MKSLIDFLEKLQENSIFFKLDKLKDSIMVEVAVPGERWEIEFMRDGSIEIEKYKSTGEIYDEKEIDALFREHTD